MKFITKDSEFFDLFDKQVKDLVYIAEILKKLMNDFSLKDELKEKFKDAEHEADITTHEIIDKVNRTFLTPLDREDIHAFAQAMDTVVDLIDASAGRIFLYKISHPTEGMKHLSDIIYKMVQEIAKAVSMLRNMKNQRRLIDHCIEINRLENEADSTLRISLQDIIEKRDDYFSFIALKEVYESLETTTDKCEDVANIIEAIVIKNI